MFDEDWFTGKGDSKGFTSRAIADLRKRKEEEQYSAEILKQEQAKEADKKQAEINSKKSVKDRFGDIAIGTGRFIKSAAVDLKDTTVGTWQGLGDVARGELASDNLEEVTKARNEMSRRHNKEANAILGDAEDATKLDAAGKKKWDEFVARSNKEREEFNAANKQKESAALEDMNTAQKVDAKKLAFQAGETVINVGTLGITSVPKQLAKQGLKVAAKQAFKSAIKTGGKELVEQMVKEGGEQLIKKGAQEVLEEGAEQVVKQGTKQVLKKAAQEGGKDALIGAAYGVTQTGKNNPDAELNDYLVNMAFGAGIGFAIPFAGAGAKAGVKKVAGTISPKAIKTGTKIADSADPNDVNALINKTIDEQSEKYGQGTFTRIKNWVGDQIDPNRAFAKIDDEYARANGIKRNKLNADESLEDLARRSAVSEREAASLFETKLSDGRSAKDLVVKYKGDSPAGMEFNNYTNAKFDLEFREKNGFKKRIQQGLDDEQLKKFVADYEVKNPDAVKDLALKKEINDMAVDYMADSGAISRAEAEQIKKAYKNAVPLERVFPDDLARPEVTGKNIGSIAKQTVIQRLEGGSDIPLSNSFDTMLNRVYKAVSQGNRAKLAQKLLERQEAGLIKGGKIAITAGNKEARATIREQIQLVNKGVRYLQKKTVISNRQMRKIASEINKLEKSGLNLALKEGGKDSLPDFTPSVLSKLKDQKGKTVGARQFYKALIEADPKDMKAIRDKIAVREPKPVDPTVALKQEARKYGSAEEFVKAQGEPLYHRSQNKFDKFDISKVSNASNRQNGGWGLYFSDSVDAIPEDAYGKYLYEVQAPKGTLLDTKNPVDEKIVSKIVNAVRGSGKNPSELSEFSYNGYLFYKTLSRVLGGDKEASLFLSKNGIDGLKKTISPTANDYILFSDKSIRTKQQLTDLYNQAHTQPTAPKPVAPQAIVAPVQKPKLAGKLDEIANYRTQIDSLKAAKTDMKEVVAEFVDDPTTGKQLISGIIDGQSYKMEVPPDLAKAVMGLDQQKLPSVLKALAIVKKPFEVTWAGVLNPVFSAISFALYDTPMSVINSPQGFRTLGPKAVKESIKSIWSGSEFQRRLAAEGARPYGGSGASAFIKPDAKALAAQRNILTKIKYTSTNPEVALSKLDVWGGKLANATRTRIARAAYDDALRMAKKEGKDITDAAVQKRAMENATLAYRSVMPDFDTMSNLTRQINSVVPFYAASVAGTRSFGKALKRDPLGTGTKALALGIIPTVGITAFSLANPAGQDFYEEMERTNPRLLDENMVVVMPGAHKDDETGEWKGIVKVPLAPEFRAINRTTWRATRAAMGKGKGPEASHVAWSLFDAATGGVRSGENPLISTRRILSGEDPRTGERIIRGDMANLPKEEQMYESTSSAGKFVGNLLNTSPIQGDKILGQFGIVGQTAKNGGDPVEAVAGNVQNRFSGAYGESASRAFYDTYSPVKAKRDRVSKEVTTLIQSGRINEAKRKAEEFNSTLGGKFSEFSKEYSGSEVYDPAWDEMMSGLFIRTGERSIEARQRQ